MPDAAIHTLGEVLEIPGPMLYRVSLPNGKVILAHLSKPLALSHVSFPTGERLLLEMTPYDFDTARILGPAPATGELETDTSRIRIPSPHHPTPAQDTS